MFAYFNYHKNNLFTGPSFLTILLLPRLQRVINISSEAHRLVDENELKSIFESQTAKRSHFKAYGASKLALILHSKALSQELIGTNKTIYTVNPGNVETAIYRHYPPLSNSVLYALQWPIRRLVIKSPQEGAQSILHTLLMEKDTSAPYISECKVAAPSPIATDNKVIASFNQLTLHQILKKKLT